MRKFFLCISVLVFFSFTGTSLKKRISDTLYRYEFYTTDEVVTAKPEREYFWFKGGSIHTSEYGMAGELLHSDYSKFYHSNQLAEVGKFDRGLKTGYWKSWFENGTLQSKIYWNEGQMDGSCYIYGLNGELIEEGKYKNNKKHGRWINYIKGDTVKYKNGSPVTPKVKDTIAKANKATFIKRLFTKKEKESVNTTEIKAAKDKKPDIFKKLFSKKNKKKKDKQPKVKQKKNKDTKDNFFKRLFQRKTTIKTR